MRPAILFRVHFLNTIFLLISLISLAQKTEKFYDYNWKECPANMARFYSTIEKTDSGYLRHDYFIHEQKLQMTGLYEDEAGKIKNGYFYFFHPNGNLQSMGKYIHGKTDGLELQYHTNGMLRDSTVFVMGSPRGTSLSWNSSGYMIDSTVMKEDMSGTRVHWFDNGTPSHAGYYSAGYKMHGKWAFYHHNGQLSSLETYEQGKLMQKQYFDEKGKEMKDTSNNDRDASFPGGNQAWQQYILKKIYFPERFKFTNGDRAIVVVSFVIDENGEVEEAFTSVPFYPDFDRIAENAIKNSPKWKPAINHNRKVKMYLRQPVTFVQEEVE